MQSIIEIKNLKKRYKDFYAVDGVSLDVYDGEIFSLLGENGAGKSTTIRTIMGLTTITDGEIIISGMDVKKERSKVNEILNYVPQETAVANNLTVRENLIFAAEIYGADKPDAVDRADMLISSFDMKEYEGRKAKALSGGMKRKLSIAMALISKPKVLFLDEPTLGLDVRARRELWEIIRSLRGKITFVLTTHYMEEAEALSDRIAVMSKGKIVAIGTLSELKTETGADSLEDIFLILTGAEKESGKLGDFFGVEQ